MTLNVNSTEMSIVNVNGTRMQVVNVNGTEVYRAENGNVTLVAADATSFSPGAEDINRHFFVVTSLFSGSALGTGPVPYINGVQCYTLYNQVNNGAGDGGNIGMFSIKIPTGTGTFTLSNTNGRFVVYRVTGCFSMTSAFSAVGGNATSIAINTPTQGCAFIANVNNFGTAFAVGGDADPSLGYNTSFNAFGAEAQTAPGGTHTYTTTFSGGSGFNQMNLAATFAYDLF